jgi:hypothetical protein
MSTLGRPTVEQVARLIRTRTKDDHMNEVGTFDDATRPTSADVEAHIDDALALVGLRLPYYAEIPADLLPAVAVTVALEVACQIEKSYWPEEVPSGQSPYDQLRQEADAALNALAGQASAATGGGTEYTSDVACVPVGSWTSIGHSPWPPPLP